MDIIGFEDKIGFVVPKLKLPTFKPMATNVKTQFSDILSKAKASGKSIIVKTPTGIKKFTPKSIFSNMMPTALKVKPFNLVPTARSFKTSNLKNKIDSKNVPMLKNEVKSFENTLQNVQAAKQAKAIFNLQPTPAIVKNLSSIQRSFLKTDLPYKIISKNNFGQPKTKFLKNSPLKFDISIDQIQPSVDFGIFDYYGK